MGLQALAGVATLLPWALLALWADQWMQVGQFDWWPLLIIVLVMLLGVVCQTLSAYFTHQMDVMVCFQLRQQLLDHLQKLPLGWFSARGAQGVSHLVERDVGALHQLVAHAPVDVTHLLVLPSLTSLYLLWLNPTLFALAAVPLVLAILGFKYLRSGAFRAVGAQRDQAMQQLSDDYGEFSRHLHLARQYPEAGIQQRVTLSAQQFNQSFSRWVSKAGHWAAIIQVVLSQPWLVIWLLLSAWGLSATGVFISLGDVCAFILLVRAIASPIQAMGHAGDALRQAVAAADRLQQVFETPPLFEREAYDVEDSKLLGVKHRSPHDDDTEASSVKVLAQGQLQVHQLCYRYPGAVHGLSDINLTVQHGESVALVGPSGSGKSTLLHLLARYMDPVSGAIWVNGVPLPSLPETIRSASIVLLDQHPAALRVSVEENIALLCPQASLEQVQRAARWACLDEVIRALPKQYQTVVGRDLKFSGGEMQRLALARAFLSEAPIILLDEPTSALDPATGSRVQANIQHHFKHQTCVMTAHRLAEIGSVDQIWVLDQGRVVEQGNHTSLLAKQGLYAQMWHQQHRDNMIMEDRSC
ncbi:ABC transporter ATP-binding protein [Terasakiispira papahanaumokuakeensis]|nr:ABC transporter ATP-binding protein [Terasakiispira papahanaumokuakeensis]